MEAELSKQVNTGGQVNTWVVATKLYGDDEIEKFKFLVDALHKLGLIPRPTPYAAVKYCINVVYDNVMRIIKERLGGDL